MDVRRRLLDLVAPHAVGDEILPGARFDGASTELGMRLRFVTARGVLWIEVAPISRAERFAARSARLAISYRTEGGRSQVASELGHALCARLAAVIASNEERVLRETSSDEVVDGARIRHVDVDALLELTGPEGDTFYTLSPYVGCLIGCRFCYAQTKIADMREIAGLPDVPWGSYVDVRRDAPEVLARELETLPPRPIKMCPVVSDPYQAVERRERLTRRCLEVIARAPTPWPVMLLTRSALVLEDLDRLAALPVVFAGVSLPTVDDTVRRHFEPRGASVEERLGILRALRGAGISTIAIVQPILAGPLEALADALAASASSVSIDVLRGVVGAEADFADPRFAHTREPRWQEDQAHALTELLAQRGIAVWTTELPPALRADAARGPLLS